MNADEPAATVQPYRTLRVTKTDEGVLSVVIDAPPMSLIGPELVHDLVGLLGEMESGQHARVMVLESADPEYFVPHVDLTKVAEYTAKPPRRAARRTRRWACCGTSSANCPWSRSRRSAPGPRGGQFSSKNLTATSSRKRSPARRHGDVCACARLRR
jgi:hypothetical protein